MDQQRIEEVFARAAAIAAPAERATFVEEACAGDPELKAAVESLLATLPDVRDFLGTPISITRESASPAEVGHRIGPYKLLERLGEGGCGEVFVAEQETPVRRRVALKVIKLGMDTRSVIARFEAERQALALMNHPNIAQVHDAGTTETGRPYFVMELVRGHQITDYCDENQLSMGERLDLFIQVCHAIQHAHQKGIIHRDIKPSNILVTLHDGVPVPKVIDFGVAKATVQQRLTDKTLYTAFEQFIGTPAYMSPEQAEMSGLDVDTRSDVYALGVLLYEMLTGRTPFDAKTLLAAGLDEMRRIIREQDPPKPSTRLSTLVEGDLRRIARSRHTEAPKLIHLLRGDLDWIVMRALEKDRTRRYESASGLAQDVQRHLGHEPVAACPPSTAYRVQKFIRRNRLMVAAGAMVAATLLLGAGLSTWQAIRATRAERRAEEARDKAVQAQNSEARQREVAETARSLAQAQELKARLNAYASDMNLAFQALRENRLGRVRGLLERHRPQPGEPDLRGWEWGHLWHESKAAALWSLEGHLDGVSCVAFSGDGKRLLSGSWDKTVRIWDLDSRQEIACLPHLGGVADLVLSADQRQLLTVTYRRGELDAGVQYQYGKVESILQYWETGSWANTANSTNNTGVTSLAVSPDGRYLAIGSRNGESILQAWESATPLATLARSENQTPAPVFAAARPILAAPDRDGIVLWNVELNRKLRTVPFDLSAYQHLPKGIPLALSPDATSLAVGGTPTQVIALNQDDQRILLTNIVAEVTCMAFSLDGAKFAVADTGRAISVWETRDWTLWASLKGHDSAATDLAFSPDGTLLASAGSDGSIRIWSVTMRPRERPFHRMPPGFRSASWSSGAAFLYLLGDNTIQIEAGFPGDFRTYREQLPFSPQGRVEVSPQGRLLAFADGQGNQGIWKVESMEKLREVGGEEVRIPFHHGFSPDETMLLGIDGGTRSRIVWRLLDGREVARLPYEQEERRLLQWWGSDSRTVMITAKNGREVLLWDVQSNVIRGVLRHEAEATSARMSPDGNLIATLDASGTVNVWNSRRGSRLYRFDKWGPTLSTPYPLDFTPDSRRLAVVTSLGEIKIYDLLSGREVGSPRLSAPAGSCRFSADGRWLGLGRPSGFTFLEATPFAQTSE